MTLFIFIFLIFFVSVDFFLAVFYPMTYNSSVFFIYDGGISDGR